MNQEWRRLARCTEFHMEAPYAAEDTPEERSFIRLACGTCPVRVECLEWALQFDDPGVLGGLNRSQRRLEQKARRKQSLFSTELCGTDAGYFRHRRLPEKACDPCRSAHNAAMLAKAAERKRERLERLGAVERVPATDTGACGTSAGYQRHRVRHEEPCGPCRAAKAARSAGYKRAG